MFLTILSKVTMRQITKWTNGQAAKFQPQMAISCPWWSMQREWKENGCPEYLRNELHEYVEFLRVSDVAVLTSASGADHLINSLFPAVTWAIAQKTQNNLIVSCFILSRDHQRILKILNLGVCILLLVLDEVQGLPSIAIQFPMYIFPPEDGRTFEAFSAQFE
jgi:hypothetical protein